MSPPDWEQLTPLGPESPAFSSFQISPVSGLLPQAHILIKVLVTRLYLVAEVAQSEIGWPQSTLCSTGGVCHQM